MIMREVTPNKKRSCFCMKIFRNLFTMSVSVVLFTSVVGMEKDRMVKFMGDFSVVSMEESDVSFMKTLHKHYQDHKSAVNAQSIIPRYKYVPSHAIALVCDALK